MPEPLAESDFPGPGAGIDTRIWRVRGTPLIEPRDARPSAPLHGLTVAVKDLFAVAGQRVGAGVPAYLAAAAIETASAPAVQHLVDAGAAVAGIAQTDEFAYSIAGANPHYGTPPNPAVPGGLPGGSSSGPASAVALAHASIGLATDTGGSIRVPASYQGLWGLRTTHGAVPRDGLLALAPTFDTVGWLTGDRATLAAVAGVALAGQGRVAAARRFAVAPALLASVPPDVRNAFESALSRAVDTGGIDAPTSVDLGDLPAAAETFRVVQAFEAWQEHGAWLAAHPGAVRGAVADRFAAAAAVTEEQAAAARVELAIRRRALRELLAETTLVLPAAASAAPQTTAGGAAIEAARRHTLQLTCFAGLAGAPALSMPIASVPGGPLGICLVGPPGSDRDLVEIAREFVADHARF